VRSPETLVKTATVTPSAGKSWILKATVGAKVSEIGLGGFPTVTLKIARETRGKIRRGAIE
jgi:hypothetical protein